LKDDTADVDDKDDAVFLEDDSMTVWWDDSEDVF